jgi:hypothetical protein
VHPTSFSEAEKVLQNRKDRTKATGGRSFLTQRIKAFPASTPRGWFPLVTAPNLFSKPLCIAIFEIAMAQYARRGSRHMKTHGFQEQKIRAHRKMFCNRISRQGLLPLKKLACKVQNTK